jgi:hypothetical protein
MDAYVYMSGPASGRMWPSEPLAVSYRRALREWCANPKHTLEGTIARLDAVIARLQAALS